MGPLYTHSFIFFFFISHYLFKFFASRDEKVYIRKMNEQPQQVYANLFTQGAQMIQFFSVSFMFDLFVSKHGPKN